MANIIFILNFLNLLLKIWQCHFYSIIIKFLQFQINLGQINFNPFIKSMNSLMNFSLYLNLLKAKQSYLYKQ